MRSTICKPTSLAAAFALSLLGAGIAARPAAAAEPTGIWVDQTGRGAVEITQCGGSLCGRIVWLQDSANRKLCGRQVIGDAQPMRAGVWDKGWIYSPEDDRKYDLELKVLSDDKLQVVGYMGSKFLSETMTWRRASPDLRRCDAPATAKPVDEARADGAKPPEAKVAEPVTGALPDRTTSAEAPASGQETAVAEADRSRREPAPAGRRSRSDDLPIKLERRKTAHGDECSVGFDKFNIAFPCLD